VGLVVIIVASFTILGVAALGLVLAQKGATPTATAASTAYVASVTQEVFALPARAPAPYSRPRSSTFPTFWPIPISHGKKGNDWAISAPCSEFRCFVRVLQWASSL